MTKFLVGICGKKFHGKDTAAMGLRDFEVVKFAGGLKIMMRSFLTYCGVSAEMIERHIEGDLKEVPVECLNGRTTRHAMQTLGTEWGRDLISASLWADTFKRRIAQFDRVVCTDMRFPNECAMIKDLGGMTVRIVNPNVQVPLDEHPSETQIDTLPVDIVIYNHSTIPVLQETFRSIVNAHFGLKEITQ